MLESCPPESRGPTATWARLFGAQTRTGLGPSAERLAYNEDVERAFRDLGDRTRPDARAIGARDLAGHGRQRAHAAWQLLLDEVAPHVDDLPPQLQFACVVSFMLVAGRHEDLLAGLRYAYRARSTSRARSTTSASLALATFNLGYLHLNHGSFHEAIERFSEVMASLAQEHDLDEPAPDHAAKPDRRPRRARRVRQRGTRSPRAGWRSSARCSSTTTASTAA